MVRSIPRLIIFLIAALLIAADADEPDVHILGETGSSAKVAIDDAATSNEQECKSPNAGGECTNPDANAIDDEAAEAPTAAEPEAAEAEAVADAETEEDPKCPSRPHIIRCAAAHLDSNKNNKLERSELENAISNLPWYARGVLKIIGSVDKIMKKCDADGDDAIGIDDDMEKTKETCLATCFKRKAFKGAFFPDCDL